MYKGNPLHYRGAACLLLPLITLRWLLLLAISFHWHAYSLLNWRLELLLLLIQLSVRASHPPFNALTHWSAFPPSISSIFLLLIHGLMLRGLEMNLLP